MLKFLALAALAALTNSATFGGYNSLNGNYNQLFCSGGNTVHGSGNFLGGADFNRIGGNGNNLIESSGNTVWGSGNKFAGANGNYNIGNGNGFIQSHANSNGGNGNFFGGSSGNYNAGNSNTYLGSNGNVNYGGNGNQFINSHGYKHHYEFIFIDFFTFRYGFLCLLSDKLIHLSS